MFFTILSTTLVYSIGSRGRGSGRRGAGEGQWMVLHYTLEVALAIVNRKTELLFCTLCMS